MKGKGLGNCGSVGMGEVGEGDRVRGELWEVEGKGYDGGEERE